MLREEFIIKLKNKLSGIPNDDLEKTIEYYNEIINDKIEEGVSEEEAVNSLGMLDDIVNNILKEIPIKKIVIEKLQPKRKLKTWEIVLLSVTGIIWIPMLIVVFALILTLYISLWSGVITSGALTISTGLTSLTTIFGVIDIFAGNISSGLVLIGIGLFSLGIAILFGILTIEFSKVMINICKKIVLKVKELFIGGGKKDNEEKEL